MSYQERDPIKAAAELPKNVRPLFQYAEQLKPTVTLICDTGARPIGRALEAVTRATGVPFPSADKTPFHYKRISTVLTAKRLATHLQDVLNPTRLSALTDEAETPRLLVIDDHTSFGSTEKLFRGACQELEITADIRWATYYKDHTPSPRPDFYCYQPKLIKSKLYTHMPWMNDPNIIGVRYDSTSVEPEVVDTPTSREFYVAIERAAQMSVTRLAQLQGPASELPAYY